MELLCWVINLYLLMIFVRIIMSWFTPEPGTTYARVYEFFFNVTEPVLGPIRQMVPMMRMGGGMGLDLSPLIVIIGAQLLLTALGCGFL